MFQRLWAYLRALVKMPVHHTAISQSLARLEARVADLDTRIANIDGLGEGLPHNLSQAIELQSLMAAGQLEFQRETRLLLGQLTLPPAELWRNGPPRGPDPAGQYIFPSSCLCRQQDLETDYFHRAMEKLGIEIHYHRKYWEFAFVLQVLTERGFIVPGARGLGFGVGQEPLPAYFASQSCIITGTDLAPDDAAAAGWTQTNEHAAGKEAMRRPAICSDDLFDANVAFECCDMNAISPRLRGYDFCWSACALEHLGSLEHGLTFIERSLDCLRPGGLAVHTTEFNLNSNTETIAQGDTVLYRRRDMWELERRLSAAGHWVAPLDFDAGDQPLDRYIDAPPYRLDPHLRLALWGYPATSIGLIIRKG